MQTMSASSAGGAQQGLPSPQVAARRREARAAAHVALHSPVPRARHALQALRLHHLAVVRHVARSGSPRQHHGLGVVVLVIRI